MALRWDPLNPIAPNNALLPAANDLIAKGIGGLTGAVQGFAKDTRDQNTEALLRQAMAVDSLAALPDARSALQSAIAGYGSGADGLKALEALNKQEANLYNTQQNINQIDQYNRGVTAEQRRLADLKSLGTIVPSILSGDASPTTLGTIGALNDPTQALGLLQSGVDRKDRKADNALDRAERQKQNQFSNNLALNSQNLTIASALNPNPGQGVTTYTQDANGNMIATTKTAPSLLETYGAVSQNRNADGSINWGGATRTGTTAPSKYNGSPQASTVTGNLRSFSNATKAGMPLAQAINRVGVRDPKHIAMMAIESGGGDMSTMSYNGSSVGPMQLNKKFAEANARKYGIKGNPLTDMDANIRTGSAMIDDLSKKFNGNTEAIGIGFNGGENAARVAYNAWLKAGQQGNVRDYIPSTYTNNGKTYNYDVKQMRDHAIKFDDAYSRLAGQPQYNKQAPQAQRGGGSTLANAAGNLFGTASIGSGQRNSVTPTSNSAPSNPFQLNGATLNQAKQGYQSALGGIKMGTNAQGRQTGTLSDQNALTNFLEDSKIDPNGSKWYKFSNDSQRVYDVLNNNPQFSNLAPKDQQDVLKEVIGYNSKNQGWLLSLNPADGKLNDRANRAMQSALDKKSRDYDEKNYGALQKAAQDLISKTPKGKNAPTLAQAMLLIDAPMYNRLKTADKKVNNPFQ